MTRGVVNYWDLSATSHLEGSVGSKLNYCKGRDEPAQTFLVLSITSKIGYSLSSAVKSDSGARTRAGSDEDCG